MTVFAVQQQKKKTNYSMKLVARTRSTVHVSVGVLINDVNEILIAQRPKGKPFPGFWEFPGGKIESQETPCQALLRELHEELGIEIDRDHPLLLGNVEYAYPEFVFQAPVFMCTSWKRQPQPLEGQRLVWVKPFDLLSYNLLPACKKICLLLQEKTDFIARERKRSIFQDSMNTIIKNAPNPTR